MVVGTRVGKLASLETIADKGTAVGFVAKRVNVILGVDDVLAVTVVVPLPLADTEALPELEGVGPVVTWLEDDGRELELEGA